MRILILEDEPFVSVVLEETLHLAGHDIVGAAATTNTGLEIAAETPFDLALVDIDLGDGGSGVDFARSLQERYGVPSIFVTGDPELANQANPVGLGYLAKPYRRASLIEAVDVAQAIIEGRKPGKIPRDLTLFDDSQARWNLQLH